MNHLVCMASGERQKQEVLEQWPSRAHVHVIIPHHEQNGERRFGETTCSIIFEGWPLIKNCWIHLRRIFEREEIKGLSNE